MFHKLTIIGNLGHDPELRYTPAGKPVATLQVAASQYDGKDENGKAKYTTVWFRVTAWGPSAEYANNTFAKGDKVLVEGTLSADPETGGPRTYTRKDGSPGASFEVHAQNVKRVAEANHKTEWKEELDEDDEDDEE